MIKFPRDLARRQTGTILVLWALIAIYALARVLQVFPDKSSTLAVVALHVLPPAAFALIHGVMVYRLRGILTFCGICLAVGGVSEYLGLRTGFPFGRYYFTDLMGPKLLNVPVLLVLAYVGMGYLAWTLALVILGQVQSSLVGLRVLTVPLIAAAVMVSWDFSMDPVWSTIEHAWIWVKGGAYFGVPVSNFLGWYFTFYVIYQLFALYLRGRPTATKSLASVDWRLAIVFYGVSAAGNLLLAVPRRGISVVTDSAGVQWRVSGITGACAVASIFTMGAFVVLAWARLKNQ